eukprot:SAG31_NODE_1320_length_8809_cov_4.243398_4_plen_71_part_00
MLRVLPQILPAYEATVQLDVFVVGFVPGSLGFEPNVSIQIPVAAPHHRQLKTLRQEACCASRCGSCTSEW